MTVIQSQIKKISLTQNSSSLRAKFFYPKIVLFEDAKCFRIIDIEDKKGDSEVKDQIYNLNEDIKGSALQDHLLWLILESGEIMVTDLLNGLQIQVIVTNYSKVKFRQVNDNYFLFKSDSGEELQNPVSTEELTDKIKEGCSDFCINLKKGSIENTDHSISTHNGLHIFIEAGKIVSHCPITKQRETLRSSVTLDYAISWGDHLILADKSKIWILDPESSSIVFEFEKFKTYVPVAVYKNVFYYLASSDHEVSLRGSHMQI